MDEEHEVKLNDEAMKLLSGYTQTEIAVRLGMSRQAVHNWYSPTCRQYKQVSDDTMNRIASWLGKPCYELCECKSSNCK